ncbi:MAG: hypothetical protein Q8R76_00885, partial [Candidatus Omnitrophota bacterium]|nr:hypothetical protein [Candidatus Omnitrophota bacterium]
MYFGRAASFEMGFLGLGQACLFCGVALYQKDWEGLLKKRKEESQRALQEWEMLEHKHQLRLENLHNLEKQASSLMDLFEIARDFSDCLSFTTLIELLRKRVMPELPFTRMRILMDPPAQKKGGTAGGDDEIECEFVIQADGARAGDGALSQREGDLLQLAKGSQSFQKEDNLWIFPLKVSTDDVLHMMVEGANPGDLAKFEVLVAHLVLQIKKIRLYETVKELSIVDSLTNVYVRRYFMERLEEELKRCLKNR